MISDIDCLLYGPQFADPQHGIDAVYKAPGGVATACRVILSASDVDFGGLGVGASTPARIVKVRVAEVPIVIEKSIFIVGDELLSVMKAMRKDRHRLIWTCEVKS